MKRQGTKIVLGYMNGSTFVPFAYAKDCEYTLKRDFQEVSSPSTGSDSCFLPKRKSWDMTCKCLLSDDNAYLFHAYDNGIPLTVCWKDMNTDGVHEQYTGTAYIEELNEGAQINNMGSFNISLKGTGKLTRTDDVPIILLTNVEQGDDSFTISIEGSGFTAGETVNISFNKTIRVTKEADSDGTISENPKITGTFTVDGWSSSPDAHIYVSEE